MEKEKAIKQIEKMEFIFNNILHLYKSCLGNKEYTKKIGGLTYKFIQVKDNWFTVNSYDYMYNNWIELKSLHGMKDFINYCIKFYEHLF